MDACRRVAKSSGYLTLYHSFVVYKKHYKKCKKGALCLLLRQGGSLESFQRVQCFPVLLHRLGELVSKLQKTKILIYPGEIVPAQHNRVDTTFSVHSDSFRIQQWSAKDSIQYSILPMNESTTELKVQTSEAENSKPAKVSCQIGDSQNPNLKISLQLLRINKAWSVEEVAEIKEAIRPGRKRTLFRSSHLADRCSLALSGGRRFSIGLRRLPAVCRMRGGNTVSQYRYQIVVRYL